MSKPRIDLVLLGATGSIGQSTVDLVRRFPDRFRIVGASARRRGRELQALAREFQIPHLLLTDPAAAATMSGAGWIDPQDGFEALLQACGSATVVNGLVGAAGLAPTVAALRRGSDVALANKEALVVGGELVLAAAREGGARILPVDSEHSAIAQCLRGNPPEEVRRLWLTASGGPFRDHDPAALAHVTLEEVLNHPTWDMGPKITVDSATMMNKGLEVVEAHLLFGIELASIEVVIHRQSIVHSMVELRDGAFLAQLGAPDMRVPILYALAGEEHWETDVAPFDPVRGGSLTFEEPDPARYPCLFLARGAAEKGGSATVVLNAANEEAVAGVLREELSFSDIPRIIEETLSAVPADPVGSVEAALDRDREARGHAQELVRAVSRSRS